MKIGFFINPIAGMGGKVGLKGTDDLADRARALGAKPIAKERAKLTLSTLKGRNFFFLTCSGPMGEDLLKELNFPSDSYKVVCYVGEKTSVEDTKNACWEFSRREVNLILFGGGDGTAQDVYEVVKRSVPLLGIPCGVKSFSSVFGINPRATGEIVKEFSQGKLELKEGEVVNTNEEEFRNNKLDVKLFGYSQVPYNKILLQERKRGFHSSADEEAKREIAKFVLEFMKDDTFYILGPGTTTLAVADALGMRASLLGVNVIKNQKIVERDVNEEKLLKILAASPPAKILVSPLGVQGFIFGRGNQQISPAVIKRVRVKNVIILATPLKLSQTPYLLVDTGDRNLDKLLSGFQAVIFGYKLAQKKKVEFLP